MSVNIQTSSGLVKIAGTPTIDTALSNVSKNPVQNKVVTEKFDEINSDVDGINRNLENQTLLSTYPYFLGFYTTSLDISGNTNWKTYTIKAKPGVKYFINGITNTGGYLPRIVGEKEDGTKVDITYIRNCDFYGDYVKYYIPVHKDDVNVSITRVDVGTMCSELRGEIKNVKDALGGLKFSVSNGTLSITDGTKTWTLS